MKFCIVAELEDQDENEVKKSIFYNRLTNSAAFCALQ